MSLDELVQVDVLEEYSPMNSTNEYLRIVQNVHTRQGSVKGYLYRAGDQLEHCEGLIEEGDWIVYCMKKGL